MRIWSVGTSTNTWPQFQRIIEQHKIGCIADVRSRPRSRLAHFSAPILRVSLNRIGISYVFLGDLIGGIPETGPGRYAAMSETIQFRTGIARLLEIIPRTRLALCCAEHDPITCHRFLLIARHLSNSAVDVEHIHRDGSVESQFDAEERLMTRWRLTNDLLSTRSDRLKEAYQRQELRLRGEPA